MKKALFILSADKFPQIYGGGIAEQIGRLVEVYAAPQTVESVQADPSLLGSAEIILSGWGAPKMDEVFLSAAPKLEAVFYGAGSVRGMVTEAFWGRGIALASAWAANAVPVAEYTLAQILCGLKQVWQYSRRVRAQGKYPPRHRVAGAFGSTVGIISLGMIGQLVCEKLKGFDVQVIAYDPFASADTARRLNVELVSLDEVFRRGDVVSLHTPWLKETEGMITGAHFRAMKKDATFINTSRGAVVCERELIDVLQERPDLLAVLDVTYPEPPRPGSPLYTLDNVVLTPHIAGSMDDECRRMGQYMLQELERYLAGQPLRWGVSRELAAKMA